MDKKEIILIATAVATGVLAACQAFDESKEPNSDEQ